MIPLRLRLAIWGYGLFRAKRAIIYPFAHAYHVLQCWIKGHTFVRTWEGEGTAYSEEEEWTGSKTTITMEGCKNCGLWRISEKNEYPPDAKLLLGVTGYIERVYLRQVKSEPFNEY